MLDLAIIIVSWNVRNYLIDCLRSVFTDLQASGLTGEVWVIDNNSTDGTRDILHGLFPNVHLLQNDHNPGFGAANNQGMQAAKEAQPRYYFLLNPDTLVRRGALRKMVDFLDDNPKAGMVGARLVYGDGRFQHSAFAFPRIKQLVFDLFPPPPLFDRLYESGFNGRYPRRLYFGQKPFQIDHPLGATMLVRQDVAEATGGFDEDFFMYCEEIDWCWRVRKAGWEIYTVPEAEIVHYGGAATKQIAAQSLINLWRSRAQFYRRHYSRLIYSISQRLVWLGMERRARQTRDPELKDAYQEIVAIWGKR